MADKSVNASAAATVHRETPIGLVPVVAIESGSLNITFPPTISGDVNVNNTSANPVPVVALDRSCVGTQTLSVTTGAVATLTVPSGAAAALIQADGSAVSVTLDGATVPTATIGLRLDDGVFMNVDSPLANVKLIARTTTTNVQVAYFDKP